MSVSSMADLASAGKTADDPSAQGLRLIATYIPSEAVAAYIALLGILVPASGTPAGDVVRVKWIALGLSLVLVVALVLYGYKPDVKDDRSVATQKRWS